MCGLTTQLCSYMAPGCISIFQEQVLNTRAEEDCIACKSQQGLVLGTTRELPFMSSGRRFTGENWGSFKALDLEHKHTSPRILSVSGPMHPATLFALLHLLC